MRVSSMATRRLPAISCRTKDARKRRTSRSGFAENGFELLDLDEKIGFEGAGDCLHDRGGPWLWTGYGFRTEIEAHEEIRNFFDKEVVSIQLTDARFYHIDTCFLSADRWLPDVPPAGFRLRVHAWRSKVVFRRTSESLLIPPTPATLRATPSTSAIR